MINLSTVAAAEDLEAALEPRFANPADRRFAARGLIQFLRTVREAGDDLPNVGAILKATVAADAIDVRRRLPPMERDFVRRARAPPAADSRRPATLPLFTSDDLATLKPSLVVRTPETFARVALAYGAAYLAAFYLLALLWWHRGIRGDEILLAAAHLLTAVGFATAAQSSGSAAGYDAVRPLHRGRAARPRADGRGLVRRFPQGGVPDAELSPACRRAVASRCS